MSPPRRIGCARGQSESPYPLILQALSAEVPADDSFEAGQVRAMFDQIGRHSPDEPTLTRTIPGFLALGSLSGCIGCDRRSYPRERPAWL